MEEDFEPNWNYCMEEEEKRAPLMLEMARGAAEIDSVPDIR